MATSTVTVVVCDIVSSTARHVRLGEEAADAFRTRFFGEVRECVAGAGGEVIKNLGDGFVIVFRRSTVDALSCAQAIHETVGRLDADDVVEMRIGVSAGEVADEDGDVFGMPVIEATRLCAAAAPRTTLTNAVVRGIAGTRGGHVFVPAGQRELKGLPSPIETWRVTTAQSMESEASVSAVAVLPVRTRRKLVALVGVLAVVAVVATVVALSRGDDSDGDDRSAAADTTGTTDTTLVSSSGPSTVATSSAVATTDVPTSIAAAEEPIPAPVGYVPTITDRDCGGDTFAEGKARTTCFTLTVPQNRANPVRTISLSGYRIASTSNDPDLPTLIDLGPEGGFENPVLDVANVVILPARGYGLTDPSISCTEMKQVGVDGLVLPSGDPGIADRMLDAVQACRDRLSASGIDVASYNYEAQVGDLIDYMWASKLPSAFITGATDDAPALLVAADRFPDAFDGIILDNPRDPGSGWREDPVDDLSAALDRYVALCNADAACASRYPTLLDDLTTQFDRLEADPVLVSGTGDGYAARNMKSLRSDPYEVLLDGPRAIRLLQYVLRVRYNYNELAQSINDPNSTAARAAVSALIGLELGDATGVKNSAELSFRCSSLPGADSSAAASAAVKPVLAGVFDPLLDAECAIWKVPQVSQEFISASTGPTPTLIGVGELAPAPAREWAAALDRSRPNVTVAIFPTVGNFVELTGPPCYQDLLRAFIVDPTSSLDVATCEADSPPIEFLT